MSEAQEPPYPSARYSAYVIGVLFLAFLMAYLDRQIITLLLPSLKADLNVSDTEVSLIQGMAFAGVYAIAGLPAGWISDRANRRNLIVAGVLVWSLATMACGLATNYWQLVLGRMGVGLGEACLSPAAVSIMADYFRPSQRGRAMSAVQVATPIGSASALFFGGMLLTTLASGDGLARLVPEGWAAWKVVFLVIGAPGLVVALLVASLKEPVRRTQNVKAASADDAPKIGFVAFFRAHPGTMSLFFCTCGVFMILSYAMGSWAPTVLMRIYGLSPREAGAIYGGILLISSVAGSLTSGVVADALVRRFPLSGRMLVPLIGLPIEICALTTFTFADSATVVISALAVSSFTTAFISGNWHPAIQDLAPNHLRGRMISILLLVGMILGLGSAPTLVALVTDQVFKDEMMLQKSLGLVAISAASLGLLMAANLPHRYAAVRRSVNTPAPPKAPLAAEPARA